MALDGVAGLEMIPLPAPLHFIPEQTGIPLA